MPATLNAPLVSELVNVVLEDALALVKTRLAPVTGAVPPQFAPVAQSVLPDDPVHVEAALVGEEPRIAIEATAKVHSGRITREGRARKLVVRMRLECAIGFIFS
jgi:hypothetical protein